MSNENMLQLPAAISLDGTEAVWIVQGGTDKRTTVGNVSNFPSTSEAFILATSSVDLQSARQLSAQTNVTTVTDNGAGSTIVVGIATNGIGNTQIRQGTALSLIGNSTNTLANVADIAAASDFQVMRRSGTAIGFGAVNLASSAAVTGTLAVGNGGTNVTTFGGTNRLLYTTTTDTLSSIATANNGVLVTSSGGAPSISSTLPSAVQTNITALGTLAANLLFVDATYDIGASSATRPRNLYLSGSVMQGAWAGTAIPVNRGGTGSDLSGTGGTSQVLQQTSAGAAVTVGQLAFSNISGTIATGQVSGSYTGITGVGTLTAGTASTGFTVDLGSISYAGVLPAARLPGFAGDVTAAAGSSTLTLANIPTGTPAVGTILHTNIAAPSSPAAGKVSVYSDSTDLRFHDKNASGVIGTTVVADTGASNNFLTAISAAGAISKAQPSFTNISGTIATGQVSGAYTGITGLGTLASNLIFTDNTYDIGASGATRPRNIYLSGSVLSGAWAGTAIPVNRGGTGSDLSGTGGTSQVLQQTSVGGAVTVAQLASSDISGNLVTSLTPGNGLTSTLTATAPGSAVTATGTLSGAQLVNAQTGTTYAILDGDRAKLITATNAAAQAYSIAQAGNASAFQAGWYVDIQNISTNVAGIVTITPTTSTINGAATHKIQPGQRARVVSDGTNYQVEQVSAAQFPGTTTNDAANAGNLGEFISSTVVSGSAVALTSGAAKTVTSISLTAGDWDVSAVNSFAAGGTTSVTDVYGSISSVDNTLDLTPGNLMSIRNPSAIVGTSEILGIPPVRYSLSGTTTIYLIALGSFTVSTLGGYGIIRARRVR